MLILGFYHRFLLEHFNEDQLHRYEAFRRNKFKKETLRRIVNQTLSQSVPPSVVIGINGYTKLLLGLLIERARDVQEQKAMVAAAYPSPPLQPHSEKAMLTKQPNGASTQESAVPASSFESSATLTNDSLSKAPSFDSHTTHQDTDSDTDRPPELNHNDIFGTMSSPPRPPTLPATPYPPGNGPKPPPSPSLQIPNPSHNTPISRSPPQPRQFPHDLSPSVVKGGEQARCKDRGELGPLLPDDVREAYRRHKRNGEGAGVGLGGLSLMGIGVQGTFANGRGGGKRLFR